MKLLLNLLKNVKRKKRIEIKESEKVYIECRYLFLDT